MRVDERHIIEGLISGDEESYRYVFHTYYAQMCILANSILMDDFLAQSTVSDVISHIYEIREELNIHSNLRSYLLTSTRNACLNSLGTKVNRTEQTFSTLDVDEVRNILSGTDRVTPQGRLLDNELVTLMTDFIESMPEPTRTTFKKSRYDGMTYRQIAAEDNISANTVKFRVKNALKMIQDHFGKYLTAMTLFFPSCIVPFAHFYCL